MEVPQGYKQTSIGIIPEDWELKKMVEVADIDKNSLKANTDPNYEFEYISLSDVNDEVFSISKSIQKFVNAPSRARRIVQQGDILLSTVRPNLKGFALIQSPVNNLIASTGFAVVTLKTAHNSFIYQFLLSDKMQKQFHSLLVGSNYPALNSSDVRNLKIPLPPLPEQQKIAEILTTWDTAIETCQKTIEQLKQRNKGLAQQLLSGKKRLEGFEDQEWNFVKFKEFYSPNKKLSGNANFELLSVTKNGIVSQEKYFNKSIASEDTSKYLIVERGDFVVSGLNFWMGSYDVLSDFEIGMVSPAYKVFRLNEKYSKSFFKHLVGSRQMKNAMISSSVVGASIVRRNFDLEVLYEYAFKMPGIGEQEAIGNVLDAAQSELKIYEGKLQNLQQQKKGLMQQLLTGKVRTV